MENHLKSMTAWYVVLVPVPVCRGGCREYTRGTVGRVRNTQLVLVGLPKRSTGPQLQSGYNQLQKQLGRNTDWSIIYLYFKHSGSHDFWCHLWSSQVILRHSFHNKKDTDGFRDAGVQRVNDVLHLLLQAWCLEQVLLWNKSEAWISACPSSSHQDSRCVLTWSLAFVYRWLTRIHTSLGIFRGFSPEPVPSTVRKFTFDLSWGNKIYYDVKNLCVCDEITCHMCDSALTAWCTLPVMDQRRFKKWEISFHTGMTGFMSNTLLKLDDNIMKRPLKAKR